MYFTIIVNIVVYFVCISGPVTFTIIMTVRHCIAILLSCLIYGHLITAVGVAGVVIVFLAIFISSYCKYKTSMDKKLKQLDTGIEVHELPTTRLDLK
jgi:hypothetical protein